MENNWLDFTGKTIIVTGGASGIGKTVAEEFLQLGGNVVVSDIHPTPPEFSSGKNFLYQPCDVSKLEEVESMIKKAKDTFGSVDVLVNNAGINLPCLLVDDTNPKGKYELNPSLYEKMMDVNVKGVYFCAQAAAREMIKQHDGVIINMSSECGLEGSEGQSVYAATKSAVNALTRSWAKELGKKGIRVVGVAPGILEETGLRTLAYEEALSYTRGIPVEKLRAGYTSTSSTPLGRSGKLTEVAYTVCFLASPKSGYTHGVTFNVAGGKTRG